MEMYPFNLRAIVVAAFMPLLKVNTLNFNGSNTFGTMEICPRQGSSS